MRLECRSRTAISCDSRERREQHFRRPAEKADRFWSAPRKRTPRPDAAGMPIAHSHYSTYLRETRAAFQTTGRKSGQVLVRTEPIIQMILGRFRGGMSGVLKLSWVPLQPFCKC